jgi:hypothetical protein
MTIRCRTTIVLLAVSRVSKGVLLETERKVGNEAESFVKPLKTNTNIINQYQ